MKSKGTKIMSTIKDKIKSIPVLTKAEERELFTRLKNGDTSALSKLMTHNLRLVASIASKYTVSTTSLDTDDLISEGVIGLKTAILKFDMERNGKLSTYATWWIKQAMTRAIFNKSKMVRLPVHIEEKLAKSRRARKYAVDVDEEFADSQDNTFYNGQFMGLARGGLINNLEAWNGEPDSRLETLEGRIDRSRLLDSIAKMKIISDKDRRTFYYSVVGESVKKIAKRFKTTPSRVKSSINRVVSTVRSSVACQDYS